MANDESSKFQHVFIWEIKNFSMNACVENKELQSPAFKAVNIHEDIVWHINFYPRGCMNEFHDNYASCFLVRCDDNPKIDRIDCEYSLQIIASNGETSYSMTKKSGFTSGFSSGFQNFVDMELLSKNPDCITNDTLTLRCHMKGKVTKEPKISRNFAETKIGFDQTTFIWDIKDVFKPDFAHKVLCRVGINTFYKLSFFTRGQTSSLSIEHDTKANPVTKVQLKVCVTDRYNVETETTHYEHLFKGGYSLWTIQSFIIRTDLNNKYSKYIIDGVLKLKCVFTASNNTQSRSMAEYQYCPPACVSAPHDVDCLEVLINDMKGLYTNRKLTDVTLRFGGHVIEAHKAILSARSKWFEAKFKNNDITEVTLNLMEPKLLNMFLEYIYTGSIEKLDRDSAYHLMAVADDYKMKSFREYCYEYCNTNILDVEASGSLNMNC